MKKPNLSNRPASSPLRRAVVPVVATAFLACSVTACAGEDIGVEEADSGVTEVEPEAVGVVDEPVDAGVSPPTDGGDDEPGTE